MAVDTRAGVRYGSLSPHHKRAAHEHHEHRNGALLERSAWEDRDREVRIFECLFRTYHLRLCAFARGYVECAAVAEELVHDVFLRMWEQRSILLGCVNPKRYLYTAVRNQAFKHIAHEAVVRRSHAMVKQEGRVPGTGEGPVRADEEVQARELAAAFEDAVDRLPARCRQAFTLYREEGMSYAEIAERMGTSVRTVETQLARANRALRRQLAEWLL